MNNLILSVFPGADLLGRGFEAEGFCVVRGPDLLWGGDVRSFHPPGGVFAGVIGGPPCQDFSRANRQPNLSDGVSAVEEFFRVVTEAGPDWFLMENVPGLPWLTFPPGWQIQRFNLNAKECGGGCRQNRLRTFVFGFKLGYELVIERAEPEAAASPCCMASEGKRLFRRKFEDFCALQGLPRDFDLPGLSLSAKYRAVGNGVPVQMARVVARAIVRRPVTMPVRVCVCHCGRPVKAGQTLATPACRKRMQRRRDASSVTGPGCDTPGLSLVDCMPAWT
jgi:DNA (cytosine-5)-methyltransferase 1